MKPHRAPRTRSATAPQPNQQKSRTATSTSPPPRPDGRRALRTRPTPSWLLEQQDLDEMARRRCVLILSVLSGERPVTEAIEEAQMNRQTYYQLEEKALRAMLRAMTPGATETQTPNAEGPALRRIAELEAKVAKLEQDKRRGERLLLLTRKLVKPGKMTTGARGRPSKLRQLSSIAGPALSPSSSPSGSAKPTTSPPGGSIPTPDGADGS
jgi:hypothetical protein